MMTEVDFYSGIRQLIGDPPVNTITNRQLQFFASTALEQLAAELEYLVREGDFIGLVSGQTNYPLPDDLLTVIWLSYNNLKLESASTWMWDRDGTSWRAPTAGKPTAFATQGRELFLNPSPSATEIATSGVMRLRYIATPMKIERGGIPWLSDLDQRIAQYLAAVLWLMGHQTPENAAMKADYEMWLSEQLPLAKRRAHNLIEDFYPGFRPVVGRQGAAR